MTTKMLNYHRAHYWNGKGQYSTVTGTAAECALWLEDRRQENK